MEDVRKCIRGLEEWEGRSQKHMHDRSELLASVRTLPRQVKQHTASQSQTSHCRAKSNSTLPRKVKQHTAAQSQTAHCRAKSNRTLPCKVKQHTASQSQAAHCLA
eukprot:2163128-Rhodomonas_salina.3